MAARLSLSSSPRICAEGKNQAGQQTYPIIVFGNLSALTNLSRSQNKASSFCNSSLSAHNVLLMRHNDCLRNRQSKQRIAVRSSYVRQVLQKRERGKCLALG